MKNRILIAAAIIVVFSAKAYTPVEDDYSTWMQMKENGRFAAAVWYDPEDPDQTAVAAESGKYYYIPAGKTMNSPDANASFSGSKLAVQGMVSDNKYSTTHTYPEFHLLGGATLKQTANTTMKGGPLLVKGTSDSPATILTQTYSNRNGWNNSMQIKGDSTAYLKYGNNNSVKTRGTYSKPFYDGYVWCNGALAEYYGTLEITPGTCLSLPAAVDACPGKLIIDGQTILDHGKTSGDITLGGLEIKSGGELLFNGGSSSTRYVVTDSFTFESGALITIFGALPRENPRELIRLTGKAAESAPASVEGLSLSTYSYRGPLPRNPKFTIENNNDGSKSIMLTFDFFKYMIKGNNYKYSCWTETSTDAWYDGEVPGTDYVGDVYYNDVSMYFYKYDNMSYKDLTLTVDNAWLHIDSYSVTLKQLNFYGTCSLGSCHGYGGLTHTVYAPIHLYNATLTLSGNSSDQRWGQVKGAITGTGSIKVYSSGSGVWKVNSDTSGFTGDVTYIGSNGELTEHPTRYAEIMAPNAFGGDYTGSTAWKAVSFTGTPWINVTADAAMNNDQRGTFINGNINLEVASGKTLTLAGISTTYGGILAQRGAGTLVLGSPAKFAVKGVQQDTPIADTNVLTIAAGTLKVTNAYAVDGCAVSFAEGTKLLLDPTATGDMATKGVVNVKWATPFATSAESGKITVEFDDSYTGYDAKTFAICTVPAEVADIFAVPETYGKRAVTTLWQDNGDETKTLYATIAARNGLLLIFN